MLEEETVRGDGGGGGTSYSYIPSASTTSTDAAFACFTGKPASYSARASRFGSSSPSGPTYGGGCAE